MEESHAFFSYRGREKETERVEKRDILSLDLELVTCIVKKEKEKKAHSYFSQHMGIPTKITLDYVYWE